MRVTFVFPLTMVTVDCGAAVTVIAPDCVGVADSATCFGALPTTCPAWAITTPLGVDSAANAGAATPKSRLAAAAIVTMGRVFLFITVLDFR